MYTRSRLILGLTYMLIALYPNEQKKDSLQLASEIKKFLESEGVDVAAPSEIASFIGCLALEKVDLSTVDFLISIGGDGTLLQLVHTQVALKAPILGVNLGGLGFMADIPKDEVYKSLKELLYGHYHLEARLMIEGETANKEPFFALNDVIIHRAKNPSLIDLAVYVDNVYLNTFSADGIIVATPTGSTAYSLAAGGPIIEPTLDALVLTPICPHAISNRPIVLRPEKEIRIEYISEKDPVELSYDGIAHYALATKDYCRIIASNKRVSLVSLSDSDYFATLRKKLGWTGSLRS